MSNNNLYSRLGGELWKTGKLVVGIVLIYTSLGWVTGTKIGEYINKRNMDNPTESRYEVDHQSIGDGMLHIQLEKNIEDMPLWS